MSKQILLYYCFIVALFITISGILTSKAGEAFLLQLFFLPVTLYLGYSIMKRRIPASSNILSKTFVFMLVVFLLLFGAGFIKIISTSQNNQVDGASSLPVQSATSTPTPAPKEQFVMIKDEYKNSSINVRQGPSIETKVITKVEHNQEYLFISKSGEWYEVLLEDETYGFIHEEFVVLSE